MSSPELAEEPLAVFPIKELPNLVGQLRIYADRLRFEIPDQPDCELLLAEHRVKSELHVGSFYNLLTIKEPRKRTFQLDHELVRAIRG